MNQQQLKWSEFHGGYSVTVIRYFNVPQMAGIYLLWNKHESGKWRCFYVGQAVNLKQRLLKHLTADEKNEDIKWNLKNNSCGFEYAVVDKQNDRDGIEKYLYDFYNPECNDFSPPDVEAIPVNFPNSDTTQR